jgi:hypothetical protein
LNINKGFGALKSIFRKHLVWLSDVLDISVDRLTVRNASCDSGVLRAWSRLAIKLSAPMNFNSIAPRLLLDGGNLISYHMLISIDFNSEQHIFQETLTDWLSVLMIVGSSEGIRHWRRNSRIRWLAPTILSTLLFILQSKWIEPDISLLDLDFGSAFQIKVRNQGNSVWTLFSVDKRISASEGPSSVSLWS